MRSLPLTALLAVWIALPAISRAEPSTAAPLPAIRLHSNSPQPLPPATESLIRQLAESTFRHLRDFPLPLFQPPAGDIRIEIFRDRPSYESAGGAKGTIGMYQSRPPRILLLESSLLPDPSVKGRLPPDYQEDILVHELVHLAMHGHRRQPIWFREGIAEYFAALHQGKGRFLTGAPEEAIRLHLTSRLGRDLPALPLPADILALNSSEWLERLPRLDPQKQYLPYASSLLLVHYHLHGHQDRRTWIRRQLENPLQARWQNAPDSSAAGVEIQKFWQSKRLKISFTPLSDL